MIIEKCRIICRSSSIIAIVAKRLQKKAHNVNSREYSRLTGSTNAGSTFRRMSDRAKHSTFAKMINATFVMNRCIRMSWWLRIAIIVFMKRVWLSGNKHLLGIRVRCVEHEQMRCGRGSASNCSCRLRERWKRLCWALKNVEFKIVIQYTYNA